MLDELTIERLRRVIHAWGEANTPLVTGQQQACSDAVEFFLNARVVRCSVHVAINESSWDGPEATRYHKVRMVSRIGGVRVRRTVAVTSNSFAQVLRTFSSTFEWDQASRLSDALRDTIPEEQWARLASGLAARTEELERDPVRQAALRTKLEARRRKIFEKERGDLVREMGRLQRRGWTEDQMDDCWREALVKDVMES
ncbi:hypothetical protein LCGC14_2726340 [marine sediment metagenome]|uniref:Uncharacterized protein n=1 Tax=marine sediment metagenome TaxID=412755 RepID=A0A0F8Z8P5_9ZZZZ